MESVLSIGDVRRATDLLDETTPETPSLDIEGLRGQMTEFVGGPGHPQTTLAIERLVNIQRAGEPAAWIGPSNSLFYPPDLAGWQPDWSALALIRLDDAHKIGRAADKLLRSGAFGLVVLDLVGLDSSKIPSPLAGRLRRLADTHDSATLLLNRNNQKDRHPPYAPLLALRVQTRWDRTDTNRLRMHCVVTRDKKRGPGYETREVYDGPLGLR